MKNIKFSARFSCISVLVIVLAGFVHGQNLKADYQFQGNLTSSVAGAPAMTNLTGSGGANSFQNDTIDGYAKQSLRFPFMSGLAVNTSGLIPRNSYTVVMLFRFDEISSFRRVASFDNRTTDDGAYMQDGRLEFENTANAAISPNTYTQVAFVREASGRVRAYRDGRFRVDVANDGGSFAITAANILSFFQDDVESPNEASPGNVARIRLYDAPMTSQQVRDLDRVPAGGETGTADLYFASIRDGFYETYRMNTDGTFQRRQTYTGTYDENRPSLSPNGQKVVFQDNALSSNQQIYVGDASGSATPVRLTTTVTTDQFPKWSPDGTKILFSRCDANGICDLFIMNADGSNQTNLTPGTASDEDLADWSPNGTNIAFSSNRSAGVYNLFVMNSSGGNVQQITNSTNPLDVNDTPRYSPNGTRIAFDGRRNAVSSTDDDEIYVINTDGSGLTALTNNTVEEFFPIWSPDGSKLAYAGIPAGSATSEVFVMNADGSNQTRLTFNSETDYPFAWRGQVVSRRTQFDFDGDGKSDVSVFRPSNGAWYLQQSTAGFTGVSFGQSDDLITPADFDGDGKTDIAVFRPSNGAWYRFNSTNGLFYAIIFGQNGDIPIPGDFDGDGKADISVFRPSNGAWYRLNSSDGSFFGTFFGQNGDKPLVADFDGDGKSDIAVFRPSAGAFYRLNSSNGGFGATAFGFGTDIPTMGDFDGDGKTDIAVFRPSNGAWYRYNSSNGTFVGVVFGQSGDIPVTADYDGDGKSDIAVFRNGLWYLQQSTSGFSAVSFGFGTDKPTESAYVQ